VPCGLPGGNGVIRRGWEYSVRQYLNGFSDAIVPVPATARTKGRRDIELDAKRAAESGRGKSGCLAAKGSRNDVELQAASIGLGNSDECVLESGAEFGFECETAAAAYAGADDEARGGEVLLDGKWAIVDRRTGW